MMSAAAAPPCVLRSIRFESSAGALRFFDCSSTLELFHPAAIASSSSSSSLNDIVVVDDSSMIGAQSSSSLLSVYRKCSGCGATLQLSSSSPTLCSLLSRPASPTASSSSTAAAPMQASVAERCDQCGSSEFIRATVLDLNGAGGCAFVEGDDRAHLLALGCFGARSVLLVQKFRDKFMRVCSMGKRDIYRVPWATVAGQDEALVNKKLHKELLLKIFSDLDIVSLCRCAQVCKLWSLLAMDGSNWQDVDLFKFQKDVKASVVENLAKRCGGFLKKLSLKGCESVQDLALKTFSEKCQFIEELNLEKYQTHVNGGKEG